MTEAKLGNSRNKSALQTPNNSQKRAARRRPRRRLLRIGVGLLLLLIISGIAAGWLVHRGGQVRTHLTSSSALLGELRTQLLQGDTAAAEGTFSELQREVSIARAAGTDPLWRAASYIPFVGANFSAVSEVTVSADDVVNRAVAPLLVDSAALDWAALAPVNGQVNIAPLERIAPKLSAAADTVRLSHERLSQIDVGELLPQVAAPLQQAVDALEQADTALGAAAAAAEVLPTMLGSEGPREYLVLVQNSAEIRATGGIPGALAVVRANEGRIELGAQRSATDLESFEPAVIVDPQQAAIYSTRMGRFMQSVNLTPDFPTAATTASEMWELRNDDADIDGVVALDPLALAEILGATGPVELSFSDPAVDRILAESGLPTSLTKDNVVPTLLSDVYAAIDEPALQDQYFAAVAAEVFKALADGQADGADLIRSVLQSSAEGRLFVWSSDDGEQAVLASSAVAGAVTGTTSGGAAFGAYFNDGTGAKMDYYMRRTVQLRRSCTIEGYLQYTLTATLTNTAPADAARSLPEYVTGGGAFGVPAGTVQTNFVGYGPDQALLQTARLNGEPVPLGSYRHGDRPVGVLTTTLAPGETATVELDFTNVVQQSEPSLDVTPTIQPPADVVLPLTGEASCL
ncbi:DUF4012 domain-containing protein [Arthrobacter sp. EH-1B-1]|uniref:DUF4012 domain-containing protein n=1 Tax=Arthrobacter vasquezii TaxID=2977629 RepID=A0ABT6CXC8_9MICC|nr:DUF4012 domain-containing protein [Arthrobacter vasquezii]MDF9278725.1 DUF4012 domain-containing protein [Arthrobacter vasquezii]